MRLTSLRDEMNRDEEMVRKRVSSSCVVSLEVQSSSEEAHVEFRRKESKRKKDSTDQRRWQRPGKPCTSNQRPHLRREEARTARTKREER